MIEMAEKSGMRALVKSRARRKNRQTPDQPTRYTIQARSIPKGTKTYERKE